MTESLEGRRRRGSPRERELPPEQEAAFQAAYQRIVAEKAAMGQTLNENPDDPRHFFKHRAAFKAGMLGMDDTGHGASKFKRLGHPDMIIDGLDTRTMTPASSRLIRRHLRAQERVDQLFINNIPVRPEVVRPRRRRRKAAGGGGGSAG